MMRLVFKLMIFVELLIIPLNIYAQSISDDQQKTIIIADNYFNEIKKGKDEAFGNLLVRTALFFLDAPYVASTLEVNDHEQLVSNLREFDCMTLVDNCIALSRANRSENADFDSYCKNLQYIRYRDGKINGYLSRLHYTTDWITDNVVKGVLTDETKSLGGKKFPNTIDFMSSHSTSYKHLKGNSARIDSVKQIEQNINSREYFYIPKTEITSRQDQIKDGDIICFTTSIDGLDISHLGIAYHQGKILTFIHASSSAKKVIINPVSIADYCTRIKTNTGIMVLRID